MKRAQRRVVITGGPCSGKTSVIRELSRRGFFTVDECAIEVISELTADLGLDGQARWRESEPARFQELILRRQRAREERIPASCDLVFLDRGVQDGLAYLRHRGLPISAEMEAAYGPCEYHTIVLLESLTRFDDRRDTGRTESRQEAEAIRDQIFAVYQGYRVPILQLPEMPLADRVAWLLSRFISPDGSGKAGRSG